MNKTMHRMNSHTSQITRYMHASSLTTCMYLVRSDAVPVEVAATLDGIGHAVESDLVRLHHLFIIMGEDTPLLSPSPTSSSSHISHYLLYLFSYLSELHVYTRAPDACIGGFLHCIQKRVELIVESHCPCSVDDATYRT